MMKIYHLLVFLSVARAGDADAMLQTSTAQVLWPVVSQLGNRSHSTMMVQQLMNGNLHSATACQPVRVTFGTNSDGTPIRHSSCVKPGIKEVYDGDRNYFLQQCSNDIITCLKAKAQTDCSVNMSQLVHACGRRWCCSEGMEGYHHKQTIKCHKMMNWLTPEEPDPESCKVGNQVTQFCTNLKDLSTNYAHALLEIQNDEHQFQASNQPASSTDLMSLDEVVNDSHILHGLQQRTSWTPVNEPLRTSTNLLEQSVAKNGACEVE